MAEDAVRQAVEAAGARLERRPLHLAPLKKDAAYVHITGHPFIELYVAQPAIVTSNA